MLGYIYTPMPHESPQLPDSPRDTTSQQTKAPAEGSKNDASRAKIKILQDVIKHLIVPLSLLSPSSIRNVTPSPVVEYANGVDVRLPEGIRTFSPSFDAARDAFTKLYSTKAGKIFFIHAKGAIEREVSIPPRLIFLQGSKNPKDREAYKTEFPIFMAGLEKEASSGSIHMASGEKFKQVEKNAKIRMKITRDLLEKAFKMKSPKELANDKEHLWDVLDARDRAKLLDLCMGIFGIESSFDPATKGGLAQFTKPMLTYLGMTDKDVSDVGKSVIGMAKLFESYYKTLTLKNGATEVVSRYGLKDGNFLIYALVDSYHRGGSNILALCRSLLEDYPDVASLPKEVRANSEEIYSFMTHRGKKGVGTYGPYSAIYIPQVSAMAERLKAAIAPNTLLMTKNTTPKKTARAPLPSKEKNIATASKVAPKWNNR